MAKKVSEEVKAAVRHGENGFVYIPWTSDAIRADIINIATGGNSKTGPVAAFNLPVEHSYNHACECYKDKICYACGGCYTYPQNQEMYAQNLKYFLTHDSNTFISQVVIMILASRLNLFRWFTCGDILNARFLECMVEVARRLPGVKFWSYTKKYAIVNKWIASNGPLPDNLVIIFSHWLNKDGTYFPMDNPYNLPTSEFIPYGKEELLQTVHHVCPCSDPDIFTTCATCPNPCYDLKPGQSMALCEHSTPATKQRDKYLREAKAAALAAGNFKLIEALEAAAKLARN